MEERHYLISDAAKMVAVEAHVLRYWEEELELPIARTELGHRYYTRENIEIFQNVKKLKEEGLQLKAIKVLLQETAKLEGAERLQQKIQHEAAQQKQEEEEAISGNTEEHAEEAGQETDMPPQETALAKMQNNAEKLQRFKELVEGIVEKVVKDNNEVLQKRIEESFAKETDYLLHRQEQREEERFRKLDEAIRSHQKNSRYVAAAKEKNHFFRWFGR